MRLPACLPRLCCLLIVAFFVCASYAAPSLWGHGYPYLVALEDNAALYTQRYALVAYDAPMRGKAGGEFSSRFIWQDAAFADVIAGGLAVGNFWPTTPASGAGTEFLALARRAGASISVEVYRAPGVFSTRPWDLQSRAGLVNDATANGTNDIVCMTAGDVLPAYSGAELLLVQSTSDDYLNDPRARLLIYSAPSATNQANWTLRHSISAATLFPPGERVIGAAAGDFTFAGRDGLALLYQSGSNKVVRYFDLASAPAVTARGTDARDFSAVAPFALAAADYVKEYQKVGWDFLTTLEPQAGVLAPCIYSNLFSGTPQALPMINGRLNAGLPVYTNAPRALTAGRIFGYLLNRYDYSSQPREPNQPAGTKDAGIAYVERWPLYSKKQSHGSFATHYGWPLPGEAIWNNVVLENTGTTPTAPGTLRISAWFNTPYRNADTHPLAMTQPDTQLVVNVALPTFLTGVATQYATQIALTYYTNWPYQFDNYSPVRRLVLSQELWNVVRLDNIGAAADDACERNNREEMAVHTWTLHPVFYPKSALSNNANPNVTGDPHSYFYLARKLCNAIQTFWERSGSTSNLDINIRVNLMGYELDDVDNAHRSWVFNGTNVWDYWEGCRGLDFNTSVSPYGYPYGVWFGHGQWQRMWLDAEGCEGHETTHLFHQMGDLYQYQVYPGWGAGAVLGDGRPLQIRTWTANPDVFSSDARQKFCKGTCDIHVPSVGMRNLGTDNWPSMAPETNMARVLTRSGAPLPGAMVKAWAYMGNTTAFISAGATLGDGTVDIQYPKRPFNRTRDSIQGYWHYADVWAGKTLYLTIDVPGYNDGWVWRQDDREYMHSSTVGLASRGALNPALDVWDVPTLYEPGAPAYPHAASIAVEGTQVRISSSAQAGNVYRVYRRIFPTYGFELATVLTASASSITLSPSLGGATRGILYLTEQSAGVESNPKIFQIATIGNAVGLTARDAETFFLALNAGTADPIISICRGSEPFAEVATHYFFGHRVIKPYYPSDQTRLLMTISSYSEWGIPPVYVTWADKYSEFSYAVYDVDANAAGGSGSFDTAPQQLLTDAGNNFIGKHVQVGDEVKVGDVRTNIIEVVSATQLRLAGVVKAGGGGASYSLMRTPGRAGTGTTNRQVSATLRGLGRVTAPGGTPHLGIADMGNARVLIWDEWTKYLAHYGTNGFAPTAVAADPLQDGAFFVISRSADKKLWRLLFDGAAVTADRTWSIAGLSTDTAASSPRQCGLAVIAGMNSTRLIAISDNSNKRVLLYELTTNNVLTLTQTITAPLPPYIAATLQGPTDVEFLDDRARGVAQLYAADGGNRVVKLSSDIVTAIVAPQVDITNETAWVPYDTTSGSIGGTNGGQVVGMMNWSNALTGAGGFFAAAPAWHIAGIDLAVGANLVTVTGTNAAGVAASDSVTITRMDVAGGPPYVDVLSTNAAWPYTVSSASVTGTNNAHVVGLLTWQNLQSGDAGTLPATLVWAISDVYLTIGNNTIVVRGTNAYGQFASDTVTYTRMVEVSTATMVNITWTSVTTPEASRGGVKLGSDGRYLYYLPGNNTRAFLRYDPQSNLWATLAQHPGRTSQDANDNSTGLEFRDGFFFAVLRHNTMTDAWGNATYGLYRYQVAGDTWAELHSNINAQGTLYAPTTTNVLYTNAGAWNNCLVTLGFLDTVCTSTVASGDHTFLGDTHRRFDCQDCGTQGNWTKRFDTHCAAFDNYVYGVKQDWVSGTNASEGDVLWRVAKNDIRTGTAGAVTNLPWNPGTGLCCVSVPASRALTRKDEVIVVRGQGINANQDGWGTATPDLAVFLVGARVWRMATPLPTSTGWGTDISEVGGDVFVKVQDSTVLYRGTAVDSGGDTQPPDVRTDALAYPTAGAVLATGVTTQLRWHVPRITDNYDGTNCIITRLAVLRSNDAVEAALVAQDLPSSAGAALWTPPAELASNSVWYVLAMTVRDLSDNATSVVFAAQAFHVVPPDTQPPVINANALLFPPAHAELVADVVTSIVWHAAGITDAVDGVNCIISRLAVVSSNSGDDVALIATNVLNTAGAATWLPPAALNVPGVTYAIALEARDQAGNAASNVFWAQPFTVVPEPASLLVLAWLCARGRHAGSD